MEKLVAKIGSNHVIIVSRIDIFFFAHFDDFIVGKLHVYGHCRGYLGASSRGVISTSFQGDTCMITHPHCVLFPSSSSPTHFHFALRANIMKTTADSVQN